MFTQRSAPPCGLVDADDEAVGGLGSLGSPPPPSGQQESGSPSRCGFCPMADSGHRNELPEQSAADSEGPRLRHPDPPGAGWRREPPSAAGGLWGRAAGRRMATMAMMGSRHGFRHEGSAADEREMPASRRQTAPGRQVSFRCRRPGVQRRLCAPFASLACRGGASSSTVVTDQHGKTGGTRRRGQSRTHTSWVRSQRSRELATPLGRPTGERIRKPLRGGPWSGVATSIGDRAWLKVRSRSPCCLRSWPALPGPVEVNSCWFPPGRATAVASLSSLARGRQGRVMPRRLASVMRSSSASSSGTDTTTKKLEVTSHGCHRR